MSVRTYYTMRCFYCGCIYKANRKNRSKYCCDQHGSMYRTHGRNEELWLESDLAIEANEFSFENNFDSKQTLRKVESDVDVLLNNKKLESARKIIATRTYYSQILLAIYNKYSWQAPDLWSVPLPESLLKRNGYLGALPQMDGIVIYGEFVIEYTSHTHNINYYKIKPLEQLSQREFESISLKWMPS